MRISFLIHNFYGIGGTNRAVLNLAHALSGRHTIEIASVFRRQDEVSLEVDPSISIRPLVDLRSGQPDRADSRHHRPSRAIPASEEFFRQYSELTDERITDYLKTTKSDVVIATRPGLNLALAKLGSRQTLKLAQEHMTSDMIHADVKEEMRRSYGQLDAAICLTGADAENLRESLGSTPTRIASIPNAIPAPGIKPADLTSKIVVAAGRLADLKRYDVLIHAFALTRERYPEWQLRIYGAGPEFPRLRKLIHELEMEECALLMGRYAPLEAEWVKGSIAAATSTHESFGMTLVEAMRCGLPVVSTSCPVGPAEIISHEIDGLLTEVNDVSGIAAALARLMGDQAERQAMGAAALRNSARFDPSHIALAYENLIDELIAAKPRSTLLSIQSGLGRGLSRLRALAADSNAALRSPGRSLRNAAPAIAPSPGKGPTVDCEITTHDQIDVYWQDAQSDIENTELLLCHREKVGQDRSLPVTSADSSGGHHTVIADSLALEEGRWNLFLSRASAEPVRVRAGIRDLRELIHGRDLDHETPLRVQLPYVTADGFLSLRVWNRLKHAECVGMTLLNEALTIRGRVNGTRVVAGESVLVIRRRQQSPVEITVALSTVEDSMFASEVDLTVLTSQRITRHDDWDFWVRDADGEEIRLARLLDDIDDRKFVYTYPITHIDPQDPFPEVEEYPEPTIRVRPYVTANSEISLYVAES